MPLAPTPQNIEAVRLVAMELWKERAAERGLPEPSDLSDSCKFSSLLAQAIFGGRIRGNNDHFFVALANGDLLDLNHDAGDVRAIRALGRDPYRDDVRFMATIDVYNSLQTCRPRVDRWVAEFHRRRRLDVAA